MIPSNESSKTKTKESNCFHVTYCDIEEKNVKTCIRIQKYLVLNRVQFIMCLAIWWKKVKACKVAGKYEEKDLSMETKKKLHRC